MNFNKFLCSAATILAMSSNVFGQSAQNGQSKPKKVKENSCDFGQGECLPCNMYPAAYNAPAGVDLRCAWDVSANASFIYWHASEEYLYLATSANNDVAYQSFSYKPGFKVGLGLDTGYDDWSASLNYTWLHQNVSSTKAAPSASTPWVATYWFNGLSGTANDNLFSTLNSKWKMHLDILDGSVSRPFYQGRNLSIASFAGLRGLWLRQRLDLSAKLSDPAFVSAPNVTSKNLSQSWSVGPNCGVAANWLTCSGFRFEGFGGGSILYTRYTKVAHSENDQVAFTSEPTTGVAGKLADYNALRYVANAGLGLGWGTYLDNSRYHVDFGARYDFMIAFSQNMMNYQNQGLLTGRSAPIGDLFMHGLTVDARFDF